MKDIRQGYWAYRNKGTGDFIVDVPYRAKNAATSGLYSHIKWHVMGASSRPTKAQIKTYASEHYELVEFELVEKAK